MVEESKSGTEVKLQKKEPLTNSLKLFTGGRERTFKIKIE
jgi:hypothetical protein